MRGRKKGGAAEVYRERDVKGRGGGALPSQKRSRFSFAFEFFSHECSGFDLFSSDLPCGGVELYVAGVKLNRPTGWGKNWVFFSRGFLIFIRLFFFLILFYSIITYFSLRSGVLFVYVSAFRKEMRKKNTNV